MMKCIRNIRKLAPCENFLLYGISRCSPQALIIEGALGGCGLGILVTTIKTSMCYVCSSKGKKISSCGIQYSKQILGNGGARGSEQCDSQNLNTEGMHTYFTSDWHLL